MLLEKKKFSSKTVLVPLILATVHISGIQILKLTFKFNSFNLSLIKMPLLYFVFVGIGKYIKDNKYVWQYKRHSWQGDTIHTIFISCFPVLCLYINIYIYVYISFDISTPLPLPPPFPLPLHLSPPPPTAMPNEWTRHLTDWSLVNRSSALFTKAAVYKGHLHYLQKQQCK